MRLRTQKFIINKTANSGDLILPVERAIENETSKLICHKMNIFIENIVFAFRKSCLLSIIYKKMIL